MPSVVARIAGRLRGRPDSEHEQAIVRFVIGAVAAYYLLHTALRDGAVSPAERATLWIIAGFFAGAVAIFALVVARPGASVARRYAAMVLDIGATTAALAVNGELAAPVFPVYLWVTFGNGFRYGLRALAVSATLSVAGYGAVLAFSDFGRTGPYVSYGLLVALVVLPLYVAFLVAKLTDALRRAEAADAAKSRFFANVGQEVRTPLHGILGVTEVLLDGQLTPEQRRSVLLVHRSAAHLLELLEDVLEFSRAGTGGEAPVEESDFDLRSALDALAEFYREIAGPDGPTVEVRVAGGVPPAIRADRAKLLQVLRNLLRNAVQHTPTGSVVLVVEDAGETQRGHLLRFSVSDTGVGIAAQDRARLFEPFLQAGRFARGEPGGMGLGLPLARELVELLGGRIELESEPGKGTKVIFTLPVAAADEAVAAPPATAPPPALPRSPAWRARPRILVVEDNALSRDVLATLLDRFGCTGVFAENGRAAVEKVARERFDLVLMDCQMPEMDGYAATREIRRRLPQAALPIVAVTAYTAQEHRDRCGEAGMDDFIAKPYRAAELLEVLTRWLSSHLAPPGTEAQALPRPDDLIGAGMPTGGIAPRAAVHEINNALTGLLGYADLLAMGLGHDARLKAYADRIVEAGERARQVLLAMPRG